MPTPVDEVKERFSKVDEVKERFSKSVATAKDGLAVLREFLIVLVLLLLLLWPGVINTRLQGAGFVEADVAGFKWKSAQQAVQKTGEVQQQVAEAKQTTEESIKKVDELAAKTNNPEVKKELETLKTTLNSSLQTTQAAEKDLQTVRQVQENVLQATRPNALVTTGSWGVVISGDRKLDEAQFEVNKAKAQGYTSVSIYDRQNSLRTVIEFPSSADAQSALPNIRAKVRNSAYAVNLDEWCPNRATTGENLYRCP
ncbi:MAG TPA: hypothetical protein VJ842_16715 [Pyrinomonadaceae bacterium]|nr:hypothetical protein [Pyrinomonadaceae bacterium]